MKYNEAIDMILDGGEAYRKGKLEYKQTFIWCDNLCGHYLHRLSGALWKYGFIIDKEDFTATDWIVEKDGVVYEEKPISCCICKEDVGREAHESTISLEGMVYNTMHSSCRSKAGKALTGGEPIAPPTPPKITIDEDWLEKKMLCFILRMRLPGNPGVKESKYKAVPGTCRDTDCPFCFPEDKPERKVTASPYAPKNFEQVFGIKPENPHPDTIDFLDCERCGMSMYKCNEMKLSLPPQAVYRCPNCDDKEDITPPENVTVSDLMSFVDYFMRSAYTRGKYQMNYMPDTEHEELATLKQKLTYLVSLQEKE